jgi:Tfp pilus assembly major pilin PilA
MNQDMQNEKVKPGIPDAARGLCWGGFFLNWIWALGNSTWIGLLTLVPFIGIVMPFVLLFKGREWAWKNNDWKSVEHFNATQRTWSVVGFCLCFIPVSGVLAAIAIPNFQRFKAKAQQSEAKTALVVVYTVEKAALISKGSFSADLQSLGVDIGKSKNYQVGFANSGAEFALYCPDCSAGAKTFKAVAFGRIGSMKKLDVWTIDQDRNLVHKIDGI